MFGSGCCDCDCVSVKFTETETESMSDRNRSRVKIHGSINRAEKCINSQKSKLVNSTEDKIA